MGGPTKIFAMAWRNGRRTVVTIAAMAFGLWVMVLLKIDGSHVTRMLWKSASRRIAPGVDGSAALRRVEAGRRPVR